MTERRVASRHRENMDSDNTAQHCAKLVCDIKNQLGKLRTATSVRNYACVCVCVHVCTPV